MTNGTRANAAPATAGFRYKPGVVWHDRGPDLSSLGRTTLPRVTARTPVLSKATKDKRQKVREEREEEGGLFGFDSAADVALTGAEGVKGFFGWAPVQNLLSGEEFINTLGGVVGRDDLGSDIRDKLEEVPTVGGFLGVAFDVGASPLTLLTAGFGGGALGVGRAGATLGATKLGRPIVGTTKALLSPIVPAGNPLQRAAAETAIVSSATMGAQGLEGLETIPFTDKKLPPGAGVVGALGTGLIGMRGVRAAQLTEEGAQLFGRPRSGLQGHAVVEAQRRELTKRGTLKQPKKTKRATEAQKREARQQGLGRVLAEEDYIDPKTGKLARRAVPGVDVYAKDYADLIMDEGESAIFGQGGWVGGLKKFATGNPSIQRALSAATDRFAIIQKSRILRVEKRLKPYLDKGKMRFARGSGIMEPRIDPNVAPQPALVGDVLEMMESKAGQTATTGADHILYIRADSPLLGTQARVVVEVSPKTGKPTKIRMVDRVVIPNKVADELEHLADIIEQTSNEMKGHNAWVKHTELAAGQRYVPRKVVDPKGNHVDIPDIPTETSLVADIQPASNWKKRKHVVYRDAHKKAADSLVNPDAKPYRYADVFEATLDYVDASKGRIERSEIANSLLILSKKMGRTKKDGERLSRVGRKNLVGSRSRRLAGTYFDEGFKGRFEKHFGDPSSLATAIANSAILKYVSRANQFIKPIRSTLDASGGFVTAAMIAYGHPIMFSRAMLAATADAIDWLDPAQLVGKAGDDRIDRFFRDERTVSAADVTFIDPRRPGDILSEYIAAGATAERRKLGKLLVPFDRHFAMIGNRLRRDMYHASIDVYERQFAREAMHRTGKSFSDSAEILDLDARRQIGRAIDRATGISSARPHVLERELLFAPGFYRSMIETLGQAVSGDGIEAALAREYLGNYVSNGLALATGVAIAQGRDPAEVLTPFDRRDLERGRLKLNPNFGTMRIKGRDVSIFGPWDSNARLATMSTNTGFEMASERDTAVLKDFLVRVAQQKGSPVVSALVSIQQDSTYSGEDPLTSTGMLTSVLPFTASQIIEEQYGSVRTDVSGAETALGASLNFLGFKERPLDPSDKLDKMAREDPRFEMPFEDLTPQEQDTLLDENPKLKETRDAQRLVGRTPAGRYFQWQTESRESLRRAEVQFYEKWQSHGGHSRKVLRDNINRLRKNHFDAAAEKLTELDVVFIADTGTPSAALNEWYSLYDYSKDITGDNIDWDIYEELEADLYARIIDGEFGDPDRANEFIEERREYEVAPELQWYEDNKTYIRDALFQEYGYWGQASRAFAKYRKQAVRAAGRDIKTLNALKRELEHALTSNDVVRAKKMHSVIGRIDSLAGKYRRVMRRKDEDLNRALFENGYVDDPRL